jgi:ABC-type bacteriocin/lantibiotic exporter with double-glycine peptidase domain
VTDEQSQVPPSGEEIHLPGPTVLPFAMAIGITLIVIGSTLTWIISAIGGVVFLVTLVRWIRDTRRDVSELPEEHLH